MIRTDRRHTLTGHCLCCGPVSTFSGVSRRGMLTGAAALGAWAASGAIVPGPRAQAAPRRIDVHHHVSPPLWLDAVKKAKLDYPPIVSWSVQKSLDEMEKAGVATAVVSPAPPHLEFLSEELAAPIARASNEWTKKLTDDHPGRFGVFAMLPMPYADACLKEIEYAFDVLKVDGIGMLTSYGNKWLGDPAFAPVFDELNRRKATVYTHPTNAVCCVNLMPGIPETVVEYGADTTRTIASLIFSGASQRYKDVNFIFSHGGGVLTAVAERFQVQMVNARGSGGKFTREGVDGELKRFYYDTAQISNAVTIEALIKLVPMTQIVFGSDFPFRSETDHVKGLTAIFKGADLAAIDRENVLRILPRLKTG